MQGVQFKAKGEKEMFVSSYPPWEDIQERAH